MKKLYEKNELTFAIVWIVVYCVLQSLANPLNNAIGGAYAASAAFCVLQTIVLFTFMQEQDIAASRQLRYMPSHWHSNDYFEIYYTYKGNCPILFQTGQLDTEPGTVVIVSPGVTHASPCYQDNCVLLYFLIRPSTFQEVFWNQLPSGSLMASFFRHALELQHETAFLRFETGSDPDISHLLCRIYQENEQDDIYKAQMLNTLMSAFFILLLRRYESTARLPRTKDFFWRHQYSAIT